MNINKIPEDIYKLMNNQSSNRPVLFNDNNFIIVQDKEHRKDSYHYTAWYRHNCKSLLDLKYIDIINIQNLINNINFESEPIIFIHYPPSIWSFHIHFVEKNHIFYEKKERIYKIEDVINNILINEKYYLLKLNI